MSAYDLELRVAITEEAESLGVTVTDQEIADYRVELGDALSDRSKDLDPLSDLNVLLRQRLLLRKIAIMKGVIRADAAEDYTTIARLHILQNELVWARERRSRVRPSK
jgi:hypothetical protein